MKKIISLLIIGILFIGICGIMTKNKLVSYNKDSECSCPNKLNKITVWVKPYCPIGKLCVQYFFPAYTCSRHYEDWGGLI